MSLKHDNDEMKEERNHASTKKKKKRKPNHRIPFAAVCGPSIKSILKHRETSIDRSYSFSHLIVGSKSVKPNQPTNQQKYKDLSRCTLPFYSVLVKTLLHSIKSTIREKQVKKIRADRSTRRKSHIFPLTDFLS